ncbi:MAG: hypothetical protein LKJ83_02665 [Eubacteriaceae bacterium]|nr:hypothetical protein [Eubacteriaceae bacterium]
MKNQFKLVAAFVAFSVCVLFTGCAGDLEEHSYSTSNVSIKYSVPNTWKEESSSNDLFYSNNDDDERDVSEAFELNKRHFNKKKYMNAKVQVKYFIKQNKKSDDVSHYKHGTITLDGKKYRYEKYLYDNSPTFDSFKDYEKNIENDSQEADQQWIVKIYIPRHYDLYTIMFMYGTDGDKDVIKQDKKDILDSIKIKNK